MILNDSIFIFQKLLTVKNVYIKLIFEGNKNTK